MQYSDEDRIKAKKQLEQEKKEMEKKQEEERGSIYDEQIDILGEKCSFTRRRIGNLPCSIYMPTQFELLSEEAKEMAFIRTKSPQYAYAADDLPFSMAVNVAESPLKDEDIRKFLNVSGRLIETMVPKATMVRTYITGTENFHIGNAEFLSLGFDGMIYNLMLFASIKGKLTIIDMSTNNSMKKYILPILKEMAESLQLEETEDGEDNV
ncbi:MAG: hypothetical protein MR531_14565 [Lachnospiraceae bacterium]|nr:hypothetical protein [Lachnospiraceae bacterium]